VVCAWYVFLEFCVRLGREEEGAEALILPLKKWKQGR